MVKGIHSFVRGAQAVKQSAIKTAGACRDATLIVTTFYPELANSPEKELLIIQKLQEWKDFFLVFWEANDE